MTATGQNATGAEPMIRLESLTKRYGDLRAVDDLTLEVPAGELVVLIGPSGCGKTTTLEMVNRLVEPTSGHIFLEGKDVTRVNVSTLRRRIGYVIQQSGLFPHMTIADNVATVPRLLRWEKQRTVERVNELLALVGLDSATHATRYPRELSGGQQQRVGVARALAADPPVMLMDEPFGATDPITREHLQDEFIRIQSELRKTIVFVTHDIDEAIKMGDRIAILGEGSYIAQYDTPEHILSAPANEFVEGFLGEGLLLKRLQLARVRDIETFDDWPKLRLDDEPAVVQETLRHISREWVLVLDEQARPRRWARTSALREGTDRLSNPGEPIQTVLQDEFSLQQALQEMLISTSGGAVVVDADGRYRGVVYIETLNRAVRSMRADAEDQLVEVDRAAGNGGARR
ncbi:MAG: betaine/proline/choline family ABC transporter ATP-binding protein [Propionibacteriales bacterium]|nr:betaine/proline/choline family ABC transporter ATP-binding protein [Propionibacteriales bacterium]